MSQTRIAIVTFCVIMNFFLLVFGIVIGDAFIVVLSCLSSGLILLPVFTSSLVIEDRYGKKEENTKEESGDQGPDA